MTQEQEIKGILVNFFREGTNGDYLDALNAAIEELKQVKNCSIPIVVGQSEQLHKLLQYLSDEDELVGGRTHQDIIDSFNKLV